MKYTIFIVLLFLISCDSQISDSNIDFKVIENSEFGVELPKQQKLIRSSIAFNQKYQQMLGNVSPTPSTPKINFEKKDVIFLHFGTFSHGGNTFKVNKVEWRGQDLIIHIIKPTRDKNAMVTAVITHPFMFIEIDKLSQQPTSILIEN